MEPNIFIINKNIIEKCKNFSEEVIKTTDYSDSNQTNKDGKTVLLYTHNQEEQNTFVRMAKDKSYEVIELEGPLVSHLISKLESDYKDIQFARVDADTIEKLIQKEDSTPSILSEKEQEKLKEIIENKIDDKKFSVQLESLSTNDSPFLITQSEFMRRMKEQQQLSGGMNMFGELPENYNLVVNSNHKLVGRLLNEENEDKKSELIKQFLDLALLSQGLLKGK